MILCERTTIRLCIFETLEKIVIFFLHLFECAATENNHEGVIPCRNDQLTSNVEDFIISFYYFGANRLTMSRVGRVMGRYVLLGSWW